MGVLSETPTFGRNIHPTRDSALLDILPFARITQYDPHGLRSTGRSSVCVGSFREREGEGEMVLQQSDKG